MANKSKTQTRKNRVKVPNVGPGKNAVKLNLKKEFKKTSITLIENKIIPIYR